MEISAKELRGFNIRQLLQYTGAVVAVAFIYSDLKNATLQNREVLREYKNESKEQSKIQEAALKNIEQQQRMTDIRLTILETQAKAK